MNSEIIKLMETPEFCEKLIKAESEAEAKELFKQYGIDIKPEDFDSLRQLMSSLESELKKLSTEQLQAISGGADDGQANNADPSKKDEKDEKSKGLTFRRLLRRADKMIKTFGPSVKSGVETVTGQLDKNRDASIRRSQIIQDGETKRHAQTMNTISGAVVTVALTGTLAGAIYFGWDSIKGWWNRT